MEEFLKNMCSFIYLSNYGLLKYIPQNHKKIIRIKKSVTTHIEQTIFLNLSSYLFRKMSIVLILYKHLYADTEFKTNFLF